VIWFARSTTRIKLGVHAQQPITRQLAETRRYPIRQTTTPVEVEGGVAGGALPSARQTSSVKPSANCQKRRVSPRPEQIELGHAHPLLDL
jgi:hypothetical protein